MQTNEKLIVTRPRNRHMRGINRKVNWYQKHKEKHTRKHRRKSPYTSIAYREYQKYLDARYGSIHAFIGGTMADQLYEAANRDGFMRKFLARSDVPRVLSPEQVAFSAKHERDKVMRELKWKARTAADKPYSRNLLYIIPENWIPWDVENGVMTREDWAAEQSALSWLSVRRIKKAFIGG
jgi:hypothetical protein